jgi:hypothetical protein
MNSSNERFAHSISTNVEFWSSRYLPQLRRFREFRGKLGGLAAGYGPRTFLYWLDTTKNAMLKQNAPRALARTEKRNT